MMIKGNESGFTLTEVLVAMTILAVGLLAIAGMQVTAMRGNSTANVSTANTAVVAGIMEKILALDAGNDLVAGTITNAVWDFEPDPAVTQTTAILDGSGSYSAIYSVVPDYDSGSGSINNVSRIEVTVTQVSGSQKSVTLTAFKRAI